MTEQEIKEIKEDIAQLKTDVADLKKEAALSNQFSREVIKPHLDNLSRKLAQMDVIGRKEFEDYKEAAEERFVDKATFAELYTRVKVAFWVVGIIGTVVIGWIVNSVLKLIS